MLFMDLEVYFQNPTSIQQRQYEALRAHFVEGVPFEEAAKRFSLSLTYLLKCRSEYQNTLKVGVEPFFILKSTGPKSRYKAEGVRELIVQLRQRNLSIVDIKVILELNHHRLSLDTIDTVLKEEGFSRLPRRTREKRQHSDVANAFRPPKTERLDELEHEYSTGASGGILCFLPLLERLGIIKIIQAVGFPETSEIPALSYILSFLALKLQGNKRISHDENWSLDSALGFFAGLNVLPKSASLSSYSYRISRDVVQRFLVGLSRVFGSLDNQEFNLDFKTIPHWGDESVLEKNYVTMRGKSMKSVLALIVQSIEGECLAYTDAGITHARKGGAVMEFVDFWKESHGVCPKMLIFDSQFTVYENLSRLNKDRIKFLTLRPRRQKMIDRAAKLRPSDWQKIEVDSGKRDPRQVNVYEEEIALQGYQGTVRQLIIIDHSKKPVFMITNDFGSTTKQLIRKYGRRWLVEQEIAEQISFFHLNQPSSSIVVKVDFDLTMTLLAHNLYRKLGQAIPGYEHCTAETLHRAFLSGRATVKTEGDQVKVTLCKRAPLPLLFEAPFVRESTTLESRGLVISFEIGTTS